MRFADTTAALNAGVAIIYQELHLVPEMTVAENIYLGQLPHKGGIVNRTLLNYEAGLQLKHLGMDIDPATPLKYLSIGQWQMVEIAKALARNAKIIAFDEPTSSLSAREIENLFRVIRELRKEGRVILYVSHRMEEIFALSDAITVFKDGRYVKTFTDMQPGQPRCAGAGDGWARSGRYLRLAATSLWRRTPAFACRKSAGRTHTHQPYGTQRRNRWAVWAGRRGPQ